MTHQYKNKWRTIVEWILLNAAFAWRMSLIPIPLGILHFEKTRPNSKHIWNFRDKLRDMARVVNSVFLLNKLVFTNAHASKLFYLANCLKRLGNDNTKELKVLNEDNSQVWINTCFQQSCGSCCVSPGVIFNVKHLENIYVDELEWNGIYIATHGTSFSTGLIYSIDGLIGKGVDRLLSMVCIDETVNALYWEHHKSQKNVASQMQSIAGQIWAAIFEKENRFGRYFDGDSQLKAVHTTLLTLTNFAVDGSCDSMNKYSQPTLTAAKIVTSSSRKKKTI